MAQGSLVFCTPTRRPRFGMSSPKATSPKAVAPAASLEAGGSPGAPTGGVEDDVPNAQPSPGVVLAGVSEAEVTRRETAWGTETLSPP